MNLAQLRSLAASVGFDDPDTAAAIAMAESGGDPHAQGDPRGPADATPNGVSSSFGLWQVHTPAWPQFDAQSLLDATYNAHAAIAIFKAAGGFTPWSTYTTDDPNLSYLRYMPAGAATIKKAWPTLKVLLVIGISSVAIAEVVKHGGVANTWRALQRAI